MARPLQSFLSIWSSQPCITVRKYLRQAACGGKRDLLSSFAVVKAGSSSPTKWVQVCSPLQRMECTADGSRDKPGHSNVVFPFKVTYPKDQGASCEASPPTDESMGWRWHKQWALAVHPLLFAHHLSASSAPILQATQGLAGKDQEDHTQYGC